jgi:hypothetical protein
MNMPLQTLQYVIFHLFHFLQGEEATAQLQDGVHGGFGSRNQQVFVLVELD